MGGPFLTLYRGRTTWDSFRVSLDRTIVPEFVELEPLKYLKCEANVLERLGKVVVLGVGLIGGSVGLALRARGLADRVVGVGRDPHKLEQARSQGAIDIGTTDLAEGLEGASVVVVCTPVNRVAADVRLVADLTSPDTLVTDAGSTKRQIVEAVESHPPAASRFVGSHPIAGSERSGAANAQAELFAGRVCVLTPTSRTPADRLDRARKFWQSLGSQVIEMSPTLHDEVLAYTSHLPHAVAGSLASAVPVEWHTVAAGAFRDGTRVAGAQTDLWTAIFRDNRGPLLKALGSLQDRVSALKFAIMTDDEEAIRRWWEEGRQRREAFESERFPKSEAT